MSEENAAIARAVVEAYRNPDVMGQLADGELDLRTYWRRWFDAWRDLQFDVDDVRQNGADVVVLIRNQRQWGRTTGIRTELPPYAQVFTMREGKLVRWRPFPTRGRPWRRSGWLPADNRRSRSALLLSSS